MSHLETWSKAVAFRYPISRYTLTILPRLVSKERGVLSFRTISIVLIIIDQTGISCRVYPIENSECLSDLVFGLKARHFFRHHH